MVDVIVCVDDHPDAPARQRADEFPDARALPVERHCIDDGRAFSRAQHRDVSAMPWMRSTSSVTCSDVSWDVAA